jgi:hypothetical protein
VNIDNAAVIVAAADLHTTGPENRPSSAEQLRVLTRLAIPDWD